MTTGKDIVIYNPVTPAREVRHFTDFEKDCIMQYVIEEVEDGKSVIWAVAQIPIAERLFYQWLELMPAWAARYKKARLKELEVAYQRIIDIERRVLLNMKDAEWLHPVAATTAIRSIGWRLEKLLRTQFGDEVEADPHAKDYTKMLLARRDDVEKQLLERKAKRRDRVKI